MSWIRQVLGLDDVVLVFSSFVQGFEGSVDG
jgi:hypothetical protein